MGKMIFWSAFLFCFFLIPAKPAVADKDIEIIRKRVLSEMMEPMVNDVSIQLLMDSLRADGTWPGINCTSNLPVVTTLNQCLLKGDVMVMNENSKSVLKLGEQTLENVKWILHDSVAYFFPDPVKVNLFDQHATGSWYKINHQSDSPRDEVKQDVYAGKSATIEF